MGFYFKKSKEKMTTGFSPIEAHHFYWGIILIFLAFASLFWWKENVAQWTFVVGMWFIIDDWIQHSIQRSEIKKYGYYQTLSFWHWFPYLILDYIKKLLNKKGEK